MTAPDDVDPVLWQQAVEAGAKALHHAEWIEGNFHETDAEHCWTQDPADHAGYYEQVQIVLAAALSVLQQATRAQVADEIDAEKAAHWDASAVLRGDRIGNAKCEGAQIGFGVAARVARGVE